MCVCVPEKCQSCCCTKARTWWFSCKETPKSCSGFDYTSNDLPFSTTKARAVFFGRTPTKLGLLYFPTSSFRGSDREIITHERTSHACNINKKNPKWHSFYAQALDVVVVVVSSLFDTGIRSFISNESSSSRLRWSRHKHTYWGSSFHVGWMREVYMLTCDNSNAFLSFVHLMSY